jgi:hypothetical protein
VSQLGASGTARRSTVSLIANMRLKISDAGAKHDLGRGLLVLGWVGTMLTAIFIALDLLQARQLSYVLTGLFSLSLVGMVIGGLLTRDSRSAALVAITAAFEASLFISISMLIAAWQVHLFPAHGRFFVLLVGSLCVCGLSGMALIYLSRRSTRRAGAI